MAKAIGIAASSVVKIWHDHGLAPHRWRSFKLSNDRNHRTTSELHQKCGRDLVRRLFIGVAAPDDIGRQSADAGDRRVQLLAGISTIGE